MIFVGIYVKLSEEQKQETDKWLKHFNLYNLRKIQFNNLSSGKRQMVLVGGR